MGIAFGGGIVLGSAVADVQSHGDAVQTIAALKAVTAEDRFDKQERFVEDPVDTYYFDAQSAAGESLPDIVAPDSGTGRWIRLVPSGGVPAAHATTHSDAGSDEVTVENLATSGAAGTVPASAGAGALTMDGAVLDADVGGSTQTGRVKRLSATTYDTIKDNQDTSDPVIGNDNTEGYEIGSRWINTTTGKEFVAFDVSTGAAVWKALVQEVETLLTGSQDLTAGTPVNLNITGATRIKRITRARFWISVNGADLGANVDTRIQLKFFNTDGFTHAELDTTLKEGLIDDFGEFQFVSSDVKVAPNNGAGSVDVDDISKFGTDDPVRIHDGTNHEFQRLTGTTGPDTLDLYDTILKAGSPAWAIDDDVTRVFELRDLVCKDEDLTDEIHLQMIPRAGDSNCRLHFVIEYEGGA